MKKYACGCGTTVIVPDIAGEDVFRCPKCHNDILYQYTDDYGNGRDYGCKHCCSSYNITHNGGNPELTCPMCGRDHKLH